MLANHPPVFMIASHEPALLDEIVPILTASGARTEIVLSAEAALAAMTAPNPPSLALLDVNLPGMEMTQLLAAVRADAGGRRFPIVLISDAIHPEWINLLTEGVIDDLIPHAAESTYWRLRLDLVLRNHHRMRELELLHESAAMNAQMDHLTGIYNRETILSILFRETDRVQRMKSSLCMILFDIDDFGHWNSRLGADACDELLCQVAGRSTRLQRSYDLLGRVGKDEFLMALPGCSSVNAVILAERLRGDVFGTPFHVAGQVVRLSACFGIASSNGRSRIVVLREAEQALQAARTAGPESIQCFESASQSPASPVIFLSPTSGGELLAW
jgi:diguanylate cyclase (GGDEF)-like protein